MENSVGVRESGCSFSVQAVSYTHLGLQLKYHSALDIPASALVPPLFVALPLCYLLCRMELGRRKLRAALILIPAVVALAPPLFYALGLSLLCLLYTSRCV